MDTIKNQSIISPQTNSPREYAKTEPQKSSEKIDFTTSQPSDNSQKGLAVERNPEKTDPSIESHVCPGDIERMRKEHGELKSQLKYFDSEIAKKEAQLYQLELEGKGVSEAAYVKVKEELGRLYQKRDELQNRLEALNNNLAGAADDVDEEPDQSPLSKAEEQNVPAQKQNLAKQKEVREICDDMFRSIDGLGTDDKRFEKTLTRLNKDNIVEVMDYWDKTYGKEYKESFMQSFLGDADNSQRAEFGAKIIAALEERAEELGLEISDLATEAKVDLHRGKGNWMPVRASHAGSINNYVRLMLQQIKLKEAQND